MSKRVLLCSPYGNGDNAVVGGIAIWGRNVISYSKSVDTPIDIIPVSFDRHSYIGDRASLLVRLYSGVKELSKAVKTSISYIEEGAFAGLSNVEWFETEAAGDYYTDEGVLFSEGGTCILAFPAGRTGRAICMP